MFVKFIDNTIQTGEKMKTEKCGQEETLEGLKLEIKSLRAQNISLRKYNNELLNETAGEAKALESLKLEIEELHVQNASLRKHNDRLFEIKIMKPIVC